MVPEFGPGTQHDYRTSPLRGAVSDTVGAGGCQPVHRLPEGTERDPTPVVFPPGCRRVHRRPSRDPAPPVAVTRYPTLEETLAVHERLIALGGSLGVCDRAGLESALARPQSGYYEDLIEEAAALWTAGCGSMRKVLGRRARSWRRRRGCAIGTSLPPSSRGANSVRGAPSPPE